MKHLDERPIAELAELEYTPPRAERMAELREQLALMPPARVRSPRRWPWIAGAAAAAAAIAAVFVLQPAPSRERPEPSQHATVTAHEGARFLHTVRAENVPEIVHLSEGTVHVVVSPLALGERMLLRTIDAELEVHGTVFDVSAHDEKLTGVEVIEGVVEVRPIGALPVILRAGGAWRPAPDETPPAPLFVPDDEEVPLPPPEPPVTTQRRASPPKKMIEVVPAHERAFRDAWAAFARGDMEAAAELFADAEAGAPQSSLAEDAAYGRALALDRAGRKHEAIAEMDRFLQLHPKSVRADEVSVSLGWLLLDAGRVDEAATRFERSVESPVPRIQRSAARGLEDAKRRR